MNVLVVNAGSSSVKYQLLNPETEVVLASGQCERIGLDGKFSYKRGEGEKAVTECDIPDHAKAVQIILAALVAPDTGVIASMKDIDAVGHRVVHGGEFFSGSVLITPEVMQKIEECSPLAPLHNPANITGITACVAVMGEDVPMVAVFDTAFHQTMPEVAYTYALPYEYYEQDRVRRYGFHGTSHKYIAARAAAMLGKPVEALKLISCHLGNGSSITAIDGGESVDTSMGFTPLAGVPMGTRAGDVDASVLPYLMQRHNLSIDEMLDIMNKKSGMIGLSEISSDFRDLEEGAGKGTAGGKRAVTAFEYGVKKYIGAYTAVMGGVDAIVFTAGVGENQFGLRARCIDTLGYLGVKIDPELNKIRGREIDISAEGATVRVLVIPTNEELMIAMDTAALVKG